MDYAARLKCPHRSEARLRLRVHIDGALADACGSGCYTTVGVAPGRIVSVQVDGFGPIQLVSFAVPLHAASADALVPHTIVWRARKEGV